MAKQKSEQEAGFEFYVRFGEEEAVNMEALSRQEQETTGKALHDTALRAAGYIPNKAGQIIE